MQEKKINKIKKIKKRSFWNAGKEKEESLEIENVSIPTTAQYIPCESESGISGSISASQSGVSIPQSAIHHPRTGISDPHRAICDSQFQSDVPNGNAAPRAAQYPPSPDLPKQLRAADATEFRHD